MTVPSTHIGDFVEILSGFAFDSEYFGDSGILPVVRIRDVVRGKSSTYYGGNFDHRYVIHDGDVLIGMDGEFNRARWRGGEALLNQRVCRIASSSDILDDRYLFHMLPRALNEIERLTPFVTVKHLSVKQIRQIKIPLPPVAQQRRIADILDKAEALRAKRRAALAQLDAFTLSIFLDMFGDPTAKESAWPLLRVGDLAEIQGGLQVSAARKDFLHEVPYLRVANVQRGYLDLSEVKVIRASGAEIARTTLLRDDLLIVEGHGNPAEIGRGALWDGSIPRCVHQNHLIRVRFDAKSIIPVYACTYLNSSFGRKHLLRAGKTTSGLNTINVSEVRATPIPKPPIDLQLQFASRVQAVGRLKASHNASHLKIDTLFASLQHRAFRGEL